MISGFKEKFGFWSKEQIKKWSSEKNWIWFHAVSVGEINAIWPLIENIKESHPSYSIMISTTTEAGHKLALDLIKNKEYLLLFFPFDLPLIINNLFKLVKLKLLIIAETEIWPFLINKCKKESIPVIIVNARISDNSYRNYQKLNFLLRKTFENISLVLSQSERDSKKYKALGVKDSNVTTMGNIKFCINYKLKIESQKPIMSNLPYPVINFASTHPGEEEIAVRTYKQLLSQNKKVNLIIAPRHLKRINGICDLIKKNNLSYKLRSKNEIVESENEIFILDTIGELRNYFKISDITVLCGSFTKIGGHNILEPIREGSYTIIGPHDFKMKEINRVFKERNALSQVKGADELISTISNALENKDIKDTTINNGKEILKENENILEEISKRISSYL